MPNVLSPRDLVSRPDNMDKTVLLLPISSLCFSSRLCLNILGINIHVNIK